MEYICLYILLIHNIGATPVASMYLKKDTTKVTFIADVHKKDNNSWVIEKNLLEALDKLDINHESKKITILWEFPSHNIKANKSLSYFIKHSQHIKNQNSFLFVGPQLDNSKLNNITIKNIDNRSCFFDLLVMWLTNDNSLAQNILTYNNFGDGTIDTLVKKISFSDVIAKIEEHISHFETIRDNYAYSENLKKIKSFVYLCKKVNNNLAASNFENFVCAWFKKYKSNKDKQTLNQAKKLFLDDFTNGYLAPCIDEEVYHAIQADPNNHIIVVTGANHALRVAHMLVDLNNYTLSRQPIIFHDFFYLRWNPSSHIFENALDLTNIHCFDFPL